MPEEIEIIPKLEEIAFPGSVSTSLAQIKDKVSAIPFFSSKLSDDELTIARIESRNIRKKPFLFQIVRLRPEGLSVVYSIAPDTSEKMRRLSVIKNVASVLSMLSGHYKVDESKFFQYIDSAIDDLLNGISQNYSALFNRYDSLISEYREIKRVNVELSASNRNLTIQATQASDNAKTLTEQLKQLQTYSDEALMAMVQDWIESHNNSIEVNDFAQGYKLPVPRIEQILDKMVSLGYLELKG